MCDCGEDLQDLVTDASSGDVICRACGVVVDSHAFDDRLEFCSEVAGSRVGAPESWLLPAPSVTFGDTKRRPRVPSDDTFAATRRFFKVVDSMSHGFLTDVVDTAKSLCRDLLLHRVVRPDSRSEHAAAALYLSTKMNGASTGRSRREISTSFGLREERLTALVKIFVRTLSAMHPALLTLDLQVEGLVVRAVSRLDITPDQRAAVKSKALEMAAAMSMAELAELEGKTPRGVCGGLVAVALTRVGLKVHRKDVASACMVSSATVEKLARLVGRA
jgi:transcription initiation factor TFIIIB Brf1 subunit/transcription initiation factor TFIIB